MIHLCWHGGLEAVSLKTVHYYFFVLCLCRRSNPHPFADYLIYCDPSRVPLFLHALETYHLQVEALCVYVLLLCYVRISRSHLDPSRLKRLLKLRVSPAKLSFRLSLR